MHSLQNHLVRHRITRAAFARRVGVSKGYVTELLKGTKRPSLLLATRIQEATCGDVPATSWVAGGAVTADEADPQ